MKKTALLSLFLLLCGCATGIPLQRYNDHPAARDDFMLCHGYGCNHMSRAGFDGKQWRKIEAVFKKSPAKTAEAERSKIARAIAMMEEFAGVKTGTAQDRAEADRVRTGPYQQDCIDETVNTNNYLTFLQEGGLLRFHEPAEPAHRGYFLDGAWPHNTAVVREKEGGALWAVDSYYRGNGEEPYIVPRADWLAGWKPQKDAAPAPQSPPAPVSAKAR
ncbi:MAG: hypothetical protein WC989_06190 [Micavibrio sp.]